MDGGYEDTAEEGAGGVIGEVVEDSGVRGYEVVHCDVM